MKRLVFLLLSLSALLSAAEDRIDFLLNKLHEKGPHNYAMIIAHRGDWRYAPENSIRGFENCIKTGFDAIEVDVRMTKDSVLVIMHDETINRTTTGRGKVSDLTLAEIKEYKLKTPTNYVSDQRVPTFEEVLELSKGKILIYVDKWQDHKEAVLEIVHKHGMDRQILLAGTTNMESDAYKLVTQYPEVNYAPFLQCNGLNDEKRFSDLQRKMKPIGYYIAFPSDTLSILKAVKKYSKKGNRLWVDTLLGSCCNGGRNDQLALSDIEASYGWLIDHGFSVFFTDDPHGVLKYLESRNMR